MTNGKAELDIPVFTAIDYLAHLRSRGLVPSIPAPRLLILCFQDELLKHVTKNWRVEKKKLFGCNLYLLKKYGNQIGVISGFGSGAPATSTVVDLFAAFGVQQFVIIGMAGGLQRELRTGSIVLSTGAIRGEGVSRHYLSPAEIVEASEEMALGVSAVLNKQNHSHFCGLTWTTDAPFRELRKDVLEYQNRGVLAVDMEAAAVLAVAKANGSSALAAFSIADTLANGVWSMSKDLRPAQIGLATLFEAVLEYGMQN